MSIITKIGLMPPQVFVFPKENTTPLDIVVTEDLTSQSLKFELKLTKEITSPVLILKQTGDMTIGTDKVSLTLLNTDTLPCEIPVGKKKQRFVWSLKDISDEEVVAWGYIILVKTVQSDYDILNPPTPLTAGQLWFTVIDINAYGVGALHIEKNTFGCTLILNYDDVGQYTLICSQAIFVDANDISVKLLPRTDTDTFQILKSASADGGTYHIKIIPQQAGGFADHDVRVMINEVIT
jgi:hypothetical protein